MPLGVKRVEPSLLLRTYRRRETFSDSVFFFPERVFNHSTPPDESTSVHDVMPWVNLGSVKMKAVLPNPKLQYVLLTGFID